MFRGSIVGLSAVGDSGGSWGVGIIRTCGKVGTTQCTQGSGKSFPNFHVTNASGIFLHLHHRPMQRE